MHTAIYFRTQLILCLLKLNETKRHTRRNDQQPTISKNDRSLHSLLVTRPFVSSSSFKVHRISTILTTQ